MSKVNYIIIDASGWQNISDFYDSLKKCFGFPSWHGENINALIDSIVYGEINEIMPPYKLEILGTSDLDKKLRDEIFFTVSCLQQSIADEGRSNEIVIIVS